MEIKNKRGTRASQRPVGFLKTREKSFSVGAACVRERRGEGVVEFYRAPESFHSLRALQSAARDEKNV